MQAVWDDGGLVMLITENKPTPRMSSMDQRIPRMPSWGEGQAHRDWDLFGVDRGRECR